MYFQRTKADQVCNNIVVLTFNDIISDVLYLSHVKVINVCLLELTKAAFAFLDEVVFMWYVIQGWSEVLMVTNFLGMDLS